MDAPASLGARGSAQRRPFEPLKSDGISLLLSRHSGTAHSGVETIFETTDKAMKVENGFCFLGCNGVIPDGTIAFVFAFWDVLIAHVMVRGRDCC